MEKAAFNKKNKKADFTRKLDLNLRKKQVIYHIWGIAVYGTSESRSEIPGKFWNAMLENDKQDQSGRSCEKWKSITKSEGGEESPTKNTVMEG